MGEETVIDKLIKHWEEKLGIELDKNKVMLINEIGYRLIDEMVEQQVTSVKEEKERSQRFKGLGLE